MNTQHWLQQNWGLLLLTILPFALIPIIYPQLPAEVPLHWNGAGEIDRVGSKQEALIPMIVIAGSLLLVNGIFWLLPWLDPKKNVEKFRPTLNRLQWIISGFLVFITLIVFSAMMGHDEWMMRLLPSSIFLFFLLIGNYFGKLRPNYFIGLRTPWTLESEDNWIKTHRLTGKIWVIASAIMFLLSLFTGFDWFLYLMVPYLLVIVGYPLWYSFRLHREASDAS
jgi:uncharacterized membrane protein